MKFVVSLTARGAPPPSALARRLRASLGPQALFSALGALRLRTPAIHACYGETSP
jgi:hypothetical protein